MKKIKLKNLEVKSFITNLSNENSETVKGGFTVDILCNKSPTGGTGGTNTNTQVPACPVSYPQIWCDGNPYETPLCTN